MKHVGYRDDKDYVCPRCGAGYLTVRWETKGSCRMNGYLARVTRKLLGLKQATKGFMTVRSGRRITPHNISRRDFAELVEFFVTGLPMKAGVRVDRKNRPDGTTDTVAGMLDAIVKDATKCAFLADALEEAGCEDAALLEALREP